MHKSRQWIRSEIIKLKKDATEKGSKYTSSDYFKLADHVELKIKTKFDKWLVAEKLNPKTRAEKDRVSREVRKWLRSLRAGRVGNSSMGPGAAMRRAIGANSPITFTTIVKQGHTLFKTLTDPGNKSGWHPKTRVHLKQDARFAKKEFEDAAKLHNQLLEVAKIALKPSAPGRTDSHWELQEKYKR